MFQGTRKKDSNTISKMFQDDENKIFPPFDDDYEPDNIEKLMEEYITPIKKEKHIRDKGLKKLNTTFISNKKVEKLNLEYMMEIGKTGGDETTKKFYREEIEKASSTIKFLDKKIKKDLAMPIEKKYIVNQLRELYGLREIYFTNKFNNSPENNKNINIKSMDDDIHKLLDKLRDQEGRGVFTYQNEFVKLLTLLTQLLTKNNSKKTKDEINQIVKKLFNLKQITKEVYNILNKAITYKE